MDNLFNLDNIDDLPEELQQDYKLNELNNTLQKVESVLNHADGKFTSQMIGVGIYRLHNDVVPRHSVNSTLSYMVKRGVLNRVSRGVYQKVEEATND